MNVTWDMIMTMMIMIVMVCECDVGYDCDGM